MIDPLAERDDWTWTPMPGSSAMVESVLLHLDPDTRARLLLVRFPPGLSRPERGRFDVGEELVVLSGRAWLSSISYRAGHYGWIPPEGTRHDLSTPDGALVLAWFSGRPQWTAGAGAPTGPSIRAPLDTMTVPPGGVPLRGGGPGDAHGATVLLPAAPREVAVPTALLWVDGWRWHRALPGEAVPERAGRVLARMEPPTVPAV
jgi:hypothetical protein